MGDHNLIGHIEQLYGSLIDVPLIISWPGKIPKGTIVDHRARHVDILPTIMDFLGVRFHGKTRGESLWPAIRGTEREERSVLGMTFRPEAGRNFVSLIHGDYKIIRIVDSGEYELYDIAHDPGELDNLVEKEIVASNRMKRKLERFLESVNFSIESISSRVESIQASEETLETLKGLGYVR